MEIIKRVYYLEELFSSMEEKVEKCRREVEITPVLLSTPAWEFIGQRYIKLLVPDYDFSVLKHIVIFFKERAFLYIFERKEM